MLVLHGFNCLFVKSCLSGRDCKTHNLCKLTTLLPLTTCLPTGAYLTVIGHLLTRICLEGIVEWLKWICEALFEQTKSHCLCKPEAIVELNYKKMLISLEWNEFYVCLRGVFVVTSNLCYICYDQSAGMYCYELLRLIIINTCIFLCTTPQTINCFCPYRFIREAYFPMYLSFKILFIPISGICLGVLEGSCNSHLVAPEPMCLPTIHIAQAGCEDETLYISVAYADMLRTALQYGVCFLIQTQYNNLISIQIFISQCQCVFAVLLMNIRTSEYNLLIGIVYQLSAHYLCSGICIKCGVSLNQHSNNHC